MKDLEATIERLRAYSNVMSMTPGDTRHQCLLWNRRTRPRVAHRWPKLAIVADGYAMRQEGFSNAGKLLEEALEVIDVLSVFPKKFEEHLDRIEGEA